MKRNFFATALVATLLVPMFANAEEAVVTTSAPVITTAVTGAPPVSTTTPSIPLTPPSQSAEFITCKKNSIEKRYTTVSTAKRVYNAAMEVAFSARKDAEISAAGLEKVGEKTANELAGRNFENASKSIQKTLNTATESARVTFQNDRDDCNKILKAYQEKARVQKEQARKSELAKKAEITKVENEKKRTEIKSIRDAANEKIKELRKLPVSSTTPPTVR